MTDLPEEIAQLQNNIDVNENIWKECGGHARAIELEWGNNKGNCIQCPDILLVADCVYYEEVMYPALHCLLTVLPILP